MATLRNRVIGMLCQAGPVNLAAALRHHARDPARPLTTLGILLKSSPHEWTFREKAGALPGSENGPSGSSTTCWSASPAPPLLAAHHRAIKTATVEGALAVAPSGRRRHPDRARPARPPGSTVDERDAAPAGPCSPARRVGRSPATRPRAMTPSDPPARRDQPSARIRVRQGRSCSCWPKPDDPRPCTRRPVIGAAGPAVPEGGRSTAAATCNISSTAPELDRLWRVRGQASAAPSENQRAMRWTAGRRCRGAHLGWCHAAATPAR
jgi:hypothetical protein